MLKSETEIYLEKKNVEYAIIKMVLKMFIKKPYLLGCHLGGISFNKLC